jgi:hypothetical protein
MLVCVECRATTRNLAMMCVYSIAMDVERWMMGQNVAKNVGRSIWSVCKMCVGL